MRDDIELREVRLDDRPSTTMDGVEDLVAVPHPASPDARAAHGRHFRWPETGRATVLDWEWRVWGAVHRVWDRLRYGP